METRGLSGQSAIEYLMTYGWMLLVVAIVGGAIFATVGNQNLESTSGFTGSDVQIDNFGLTESDDLQLEMRSSTSEGSTVTAINVTDDASGEFIYKEYSSNNEVNVGETEIFNLPNVTESDGSNTLRVRIIYSNGGLENMEVSGTISGSLSVDETTVSETDDSGDSGSGDDGSNDGSNDGDDGGSGGAADTWSEPVSTAPSCNSYPGKYNGSGTESDPYIIMNSSGLQCMNQSLDSSYALGQNINASGTGGWHNGKGFDPVGDFPDEFQGNLDGQNYTIKKLTISRPDMSYVSVLGRIDSQIKNIGIVEANITGDLQVGALSGYNEGGWINNSYSTGKVSGNYQVGGLSGYNSDRADIEQSYSTANVNGIDNVGGLLGLNFENTLIKESYATGNVSGTENVGGLIGSNSGQINNSYSEGDVSGSDDVGGFVGSFKGYVNNSYSIGTSYGNVAAGGFIGNKTGGQVNSGYWDLQESKNETSDGGVGLNTSDMQGSNAEGNMTGLDFENTWKAVPGDYPELQWQS